jgi:hypothetical protein
MRRSAMVGAVLMAGTVLGMLTLAALAVPSAAAADGATVTRSPISASAFVPCALGGAGEQVLVQGTVHTVLVANTDAAGGTHFVLRSNYDSLAGSGQTSGTLYHAVAAEGSSSHNFEPFVGPPYNFTFTEHVRFVGAGPGNDFTVTVNNHVTVNANDGLTANRSVLSVSCG